MPFEAGKSGNPSGRPKGAINHEKRSIRLWLDKFLDANTDEMEADLKALPPKDRLYIILGLMEYSVPKLNRTELQADVDLNTGGIPVTEWVKTNGGKPE